MSKIPPAGPQIPLTGLHSSPAGRCAALIGFFLLALPAQAQVADSVRVREGTGTVAPADSLVPPPTGVPLAPAAEGGLDGEVTYAARDSVRIVLAPRAGRAADAPPPDDTVTLFGDARATYQTATITAGRLDVRTAAQTVTAEGRSTDGPPAFADGSETFTGQQFTYNFETRRGRVVGARTAIQDGFLLGGIVKQAAPDIVYAQDAAYTTCDLDHPHYELVAGRLKIVEGRHVYSGPVRLKLLGLTLPLVLPFGYVPAAEGRRSGPLPVRYGRESGFGLFLDNVGWYWAISDFLDAQATAKVGTEGSFQVRSGVRYNRRYFYNGTLSVDAGRLRRGESTDPGFSPQVPLAVRWNHQQEFADGTRLSGAVNLQSTSQRLVADAVSQQITQSTQSSVNLSKSWPRVGRSLSLSGQASQNFVTNRTEATLPTLSASQQRVFPFRRGRPERWYEEIAVSYSATGSNRFSFQPLSDSTGVSVLDALFSPGAFTQATGTTDRFVYRFDQRVPIQATYRINRFNLALGPSVNLQEIWAGSREVRTFDPATGTVRATTESGFAAARRAEARLDASSEFFGTFNVRAGALDGVRHIVRPRVGIAFEPDYGALGFVREVQADTLGRTARYPILSGIPTEPTRTLSFGIDNTVQARLARTDSTGETTRRVVQVLTANVSGGVNFAAPERPVRDISASAQSQLFGVRATASAQFSPYALDPAGQLLPTSYLAQTGRPARLTSANLTLGRTVGTRTAGRAPDVRAVPVGALGPTEPLPSGAAPLQGPGSGLDVPRSAAVGYLDASADFSASLDLTVNTRAAFGPVPAQTTAALSVTQFSARLTPNWFLNGSTGLDLQTLRPTTTSLGLRRDLHCWEMQITWQPIGFTRGFGVSLAVKQGVLRDFLRLDVPRSVVRALPF